MNGNLDYTIGNNFMVSVRAGYFFLGTQNKLDASAANIARGPLYQFRLSNATTGRAYPTTIAPPAG